MQNKKLWLIGILVFLINYPGCLSFDPKTIQVKKYIDDQIPGLELVIDENSINTLVDRFNYEMENQKLWKLQFKDMKSELFIKSLRNRLSFGEKKNQIKQGYLSITMKKIESYSNNDENTGCCWDSFCGVAPLLPPLGMTAVWGWPYYYLSISMEFNVKIYNVDKVEVLSFSVNGSCINSTGLYWGYYRDSIGPATMINAIDDTATQVNKKLKKHKDLLISKLALK